MTERIDLSALTRAASGPSVLLASGIVSQGGHGTDFAGWSDVSSVYVDAKAELRDGSRGFARLVLTVEGSADGISWSTVETFTFGHSGRQTATVDTPDDHLRVSWDVQGGSEWSIEYVRAKPAVVDAPGGGGGGSELWQVFQLPIAFDTPNIILPDAPAPPGSAGVTIHMPNVGDQLVAYSVSITVAWNGTTPRLYIGAQGCDPNNVGDQFSGGQNLAVANGSSGSFGYDVAGAGAFSVWPDVASAAVPLQAYIGSNTAPYGDPGSSQGEGLITVIFIPAP